jgi:serine/threonine protein kinase
MLRSYFHFFSNVILPSAYLNGEVVSPDNIIERTMSAGSLPFATYHRASQVGEGTYGSVVTVYNDDGDEFALKLFFPDAGDDGAEEQVKPIELGALREISCLRLLREDYQHPSIIRLCDVQPEWTDEEGGAGTSGCLGMAVPLYQTGSLADAIDKKTFQGYPRGVKVQLAHHILAAVDFLHSNGILHRDIKSDNILLDHNKEDNTWKALLIDFSLAKPVDDTIYRGRSLLDVSNTRGDAASTNEASKHTGSVCTLVYTAPEVFQQKPYGKPMDLWSVGVVLLELLLNQSIEGTKHKQVIEAIEQALDSLPNGQPFPDLVRSLLRTDASERLTARQALQHPLFVEKFDFPVPDVSLVHVATALPYDEALGENSSPNQARKKSSKRKERLASIERICQKLGSEQKLTRQAALEYSEQLEQLDDSIGDLAQSQSLLDCVVLAHRFFELEVLDLQGLNDEHSGLFASWSLEDYVDNEATIFMMLDFCLYPRNPMF